MIKKSQSTGKQPNKNRIIKELYEEVYFNRLLRALKKEENVSKTTCDIRFDDLEERVCRKLEHKVLIDVFKTHRTTFIDN